MMHNVFSIIGSNGKEVFGNKWTIDDAKGNIIIVHGMGEYSFRYNEFAQFLNKNGYNVYALDHLGHGKSIINDKPKMYIGKLGSWDYLVKDIHTLYEIINEEYKLPTYLISSINSFIEDIFFPLNLFSAISVHNRIVAFKDFN